MVDVVQLFTMAEDEGIEVIYRTLPPDYRALYVAARKRKTIIIDRRHMNSDRDLRCLLAEELGHHFTGSTYDINTGGFARTACEARAVTWAVDFLIDTRGFMVCLERGDDYWEIAAEFGVWPEFVWFKARLLGEKYGKEETA